VAADRADDKPWRALRDAEGREARLEEVRRLSAEGLDATEIAARMGVAPWVAERDLRAVSSGD
jgi:hypothetical protein